MHITTPLIHSMALSDASGHEVWLKMEVAQPTGSFKIRGMGHACSEYAKRGAKKFVCSSGGNAGLSVAYAGRNLGIPVTIVVPETTKPRAIELIKLEKAEVIIIGENWNASHEYAMGLVGGDCAYIHPYDDPLLWQGHATMIDEVAAEWGGVKPDLIITSVGGGGLLCGIAEGMKRQSWEDVPILAVETQGAACLNAALSADSLVKLKSIESIATSLGALQVAESAFDLRHDFNLISQIVTDAQSLSAMCGILDDHRVLVEPACGASLAAVYEGYLPKDTGRVLVIVCGGVGVTLRQLQVWLDEFDIESR